MSEPVPAVEPGTVEQNPAPPQGGEAAPAPPASQPAAGELVLSPEVQAFIKQAIADEMNEFAKFVDEKIADVEEKALNIVADPATLQGLIGELRKDVEGIALKIKHWV